MIDKDVNLDCYNFMAEIRDSYGEYAENIYISAGLLAVKEMPINLKKHYFLPMQKSFIHSKLSVW